MGRPLNKRNFGTGAGNIQVTSWRKESGVEDQTAGAIIRQRSTRKFLVSANGAEEIMTLVNKAQGTLDPSEFIVNAKDDSGTATQVTKFRNRTIQTEGSANFGYSLSDSNAATSAVRTVDVI